MKLDFNSLTFKNWMYIMSFSVSILTLLWVLQVIFLNNYYSVMKTGEIAKIGNDIVNSYGSEEFTEKLRDYAFNNHISISISDENGVVAVDVDAFDTFSNVPGRTPARPDGLKRPEFEEMKKRLADNGEKTVNFIRGDRDRTIVFFGALLNTAPDPPLYLFISSPLAPIGSATAVLKNQLIIITGILLLLSLILAQLVSRRLSVPIIRLTKSARELASGNFGVTFSGGGYTEVQQLASTLNYATKELSKLEEYRKDFIANVSHDLKTPLTIVKFYAEIIKDVSGDVPAKRDAHCELIIKEADRLTGLVNELLDLSKLQSGNARLVLSNFDLSAALSEILAGFNVLCDRDGFIFNAHIAEALIVRADEAMIKRVLYNLISNALNYTGGDMSVTARLFITDAGMARFEVIDSGAGIPGDELSNIWERYYKAAGAHKRSVSGTGTGLGLPIVKSILTAHGFPFGVISEIGHGSTFWFELPLQTTYEN